MTVILAIVGCLFWSRSVDSFRTLSVGKNINLHSRYDTKRYSSILQIIKDRFSPKIVEEPKSEQDIMLDFLIDRPWRAPKVRNLKTVYRPWKDGWMERYREEDDDTIYSYSAPKKKFGDTRANEVWFWPWMWTKVKAERLSWIMQVFQEDVDAVTIQEHMEIDNFFSEFDLPVRWGILRIKEFDVLNVIILNLVFFTDFNGVRPTDLGLRPDGSLKTCAVQFQNCISSSNSPTDTDHYAAPFKWSRSKSPDQAYDEIKEVYFKYPKRGVKWSNGWIDRGGWKPQEFDGSYFHAQADSSTWHYTDDIELVVDVATREVQYRSSTRIGQRDWDVQRLRYNQFQRMLAKKGGWEIQPMVRLNWFARTPFRWTELLTDKAIDATERTTDYVIASVKGLSSDGGGNNEGTEVAGGTQRAFQEATEVLQPYMERYKESLKPLNDKIENFGSSLTSDERVTKVVDKFTEYENRAENALTDIRATVRKYASDFTHSASDLLSLYQDPSSTVDIKLREEMDKKNSELKSIFTDEMKSNGKVPDTDPVPEGLPLPSKIEMAEDKLDVGGTVATGDMKVDKKTMLKKKVDDKNKAESDNDIEWLVDGYNINAPEGGEKKGMGSLGRGVNARRAQQGLQQPVSPVRDVQETRILKLRLDELRKANGLYVSEVNEAVEEKLID
eukprot:CAMPEP_0119037526 /NCGR_PEP_ID=MMETSP1177-20130426/5940_1 /TAXON_ID=2985 /ORGANISM="Ochromonas sp, Strain CCMP1899" /LENGTH=669 /DNA_ID=CAMNT_0006998923 /DNA_START=150 /DNA_END=2156 /DNA_ORIENTATION=+